VIMLDIEHRIGLDWCHLYGEYRRENLLLYRICFMQCNAVYLRVFRRYL